MVVDGKCSTRKEAQARLIGYDQIFFLCLARAGSLHSEARPPMLAHFACVSSENGFNGALFIFPVLSREIEDDDTEYPILGKNILSIFPFYGRISFNIN
jgi:hypothetical protein